MLLIERGKKIYEGNPKEGLSSPNVRKYIGSYDEIGKLLEENHT